MNTTALDYRFIHAFDRDSARFYAASAAVHLALLLVIMSVPDRASSLELDGYFASDKFVQLGLTPEQIEEPEPAEPGSNDLSADAAAAGEEGEAGSEDAPEDEGRLAIEGPSENEEIELRESRDLEIASNAGIARELMASSPWGESPTSVGSDALHALGNLDARSVGRAKGFGGLLLSGAGRGGGGVSEKSLGLDHRVRTKGRDTGYGVGLEGLDPGERPTKLPPRVTWEEPVVGGGLDREIIQRVVRQHRREIKACYEEGLAKNAKLSGEVKIKFTIAPTGKVISSIVGDSSLDDAGVESCITGRIRRWVFPEPKGGQMVIVKYPFRFFRG